MNGLRGLLRRGAHFLAVAGCVVAAMPTFAQDGAADLWTKRSLPPGLKPPPEARTTIAVDVRVGLLRTSTRLSLPLPDGGKLAVTRNRIASTPKGFVWSGTVDKQSIGSVTFSVVNEVVAGSILNGKGQSFRLRRDVTGVYLLEEIDLNKMPPEARPKSASSQNIQGADTALETCATDSGAEIDVMVIYTDAARAYAGADVLESDIYQAVEQANDSYIKSDVGQRLRLVHVAEMSYTESGNASTDLTRLEGKTEGFLDGVHGLRNSHGADLVVLVTETLGECGIATVMDTVANAFESHAFAVVRRDCMSVAGKYTLVHELGHLMGARHDWRDDGLGTPYMFSHGHVEPTPPVGSPWRTVMAHHGACEDAGIDCPRVLHWSNPDIDIDGRPTGVRFGTGADPQENQLTLEKTALTVANFRCSSPGRSDTWMKDAWSDVGAEPDSALAGQPMWESPYIWVRRAQDTPLIRQHEHENPISGQQNFIYVKLHNGGAQISGNLELRVANATLGLGWPGSWTMVPSAPVTVTLAAQASRIVGLPWTPSASGHFCLVARWESAGDPMTTPEGANIDVNVRGNNNIVWRNVHLIDLADADVNADAAFEVPGVGAGRAFNLAIRPVPTRRPAGRRVPAYMDFGRVLLTLDDRLMQAWKRTSFKGTGLRRDGSTVIVVDPEGAQLTLDGVSEPGQARILFARPKGGKFPRGEFGWRVTQSAADKAKPPIEGGITYKVRTVAR